MATPQSTAPASKGGSKKQHTQKLNKKTDIVQQERDDGSAVGQQLPADTPKREQTAFEKRYYEGRGRCEACGVFDGVREDSTHCDSCGAKVA